MNRYDSMVKAESEQVSWAIFRVYHVADLEQVLFLCHIYISSLLHEQQAERKRVATHSSIHVFFLPQSKFKFCSRVNGSQNKFHIIGLAYVTE